jgi:hypothetical protein
MSNKQIKIDNPDQEVAPKMLARQLTKLADAAVQLLNSGLLRKDLVRLLAGRSVESQTTVERVLDAIEELGHDYAKL